MTLPKGVTPKKIVKALRPGADCLPTYLNGVEYRVFVGYDRIGRGQTEAIAYLSACETLAEEDPEAFVKAVYPEAICEGCHIWAKLNFLGYGVSPGLAWLSAAHNILGELRKSK